MKLNRWQLVVELTYDVTEEDIKEKYPGDTEVDFSRRSLERIRAGLEKILQDSPFAHYHIMEMPKRCSETD